MLGRNKLPVFEGALTLDYDHEGVIGTDTRMSKALANDDFDMHDPQGEDDCSYNIEKARVDGLLESIVNQATSRTNACSLDTRKVRQNTKKEVDNHVDIDGCVIPTADTRNTMTSKMDPLVPCFNNTYGSANPSERNLETMYQTGAWVLTDTYNKMEESQVVVIQEEDDQVLPQGHCLTEEAYQMVVHGENGCQTRTSSMHSSLGHSASTNLPTSSKGKGMMKTAASRKHNKQEQTRRDLINQKMKTLHDLVPYQRRSVKASKELLLTEVIRYTKRLQAQVETMMSMPSTVPCAMMDYPMTANTAINNMANEQHMYSTMAHPQLDAMGSTYWLDKR